jgi:hypothetical protein
VGWQVLAAVSSVRQHEQPAAMVAADLFTGRTPVLRGDIDHHHIGRRETFGQLDRGPNYLQLAFLYEQQA